MPIINENDTVATTEIRYGDNDRLAARVATMMGADLLVLLSDIDGLYTAPPALDPNAQFIPLVDRITPEIEAMAGAAASELSRGGMRTKLDAGKIATAAGTAMIIALGARDNPLPAIERGERHTLFRPSSNPVKGYKTWIAGQLEPAGRLTVDAGAIGALMSGKSLLAGRGPAGQRRLFAWRYGRHPVARGPGDRARAGCLRRRRCRKDCRAEDGRDRGRSGLSGPFGHGSPGRPGGEPCRRGRRKRKDEPC